MLSEQDFKTVVRCAPLFSIDIAVINSNKELLLGRRVNAPAKDKWFVPGGRVRKDERLEVAFNRIVTAELGIVYSMSKAESLGLYEHFYDDSCFDGSVGTHYINTTYLIREDIALGALPRVQHNEYCWLNLDVVRETPDVHSNNFLLLEKIELLL